MSTKVITIEQQNWGFYTHAEVIISSCNKIKVDTLRFYFHGCLLTFVMIYTFACFLKILF